jgi:hypothetical protein
LFVLSLAGLALPAGCGSEEAGNRGQGGSSGGASAGHSGTGGAAGATSATGTGGTSGTGGTAGKGGAAGAGGAAGTGGATGTGGASGGAPGTGGATGAGGANGGATGTGGANGGATGTGGAAGTGGAPGSGGATGAGGSSGGATGTGGANGTGGASGGATGAGGAAGSGGGAGAGGSAGAGGATGGAPGTGGSASGGSGGAGGQAGAGSGGVGGAAGAGGTSACGPCNAPPTDCYATTGTCVQGACTYAFIEGAGCDDGNPCTIDDTCTAGACTGTPMVCTTPNAPACTDATHLRTYDNPGVCNGGRCVYTPETVTCGSGGCASGACQTDPCANVSCSSPPSVCYDAAGTCSQGSCNYPTNHATCDDGNACTDNDTCSGGVCSGTPKLCNTPPADSCADASTATVHDHVGTCSGGACSYAIHYVSCSAGCNGGACNPSGWTTMTSNTNQTLHAIWGTSASSVWAVGNGGTALYYNGIQWQARPTPAAVSSDSFISVSGTSDSNIFAVGEPSNSLNTGTSVMRFDGTSWSSLGRIQIAGQYRAACVGAYAANDAFVLGYVNITPGNNDGVAVYRVTNGTATYIMSITSLGFSNLTQCGVQAFSLTNIVATGAGQVFQIDSVAKTATAIGTGSVNQGGALWADATNDLFITSAANVDQWTGGTTWNSLGTGLSGVLYGISATSSSRLFAAGQNYTTTANLGTVLFWNGVGWTVQSLPAATATLYGIYASPLPQGQVFAVGNNGTIVTGP